MRIEESGKECDMTMYNAMYLFNFMLIFMLLILVNVPLGSSSLGLGIYIRYVFK